ncbi:hypothetical protein ACS386_13635 [Flavobacteriaceae bacterium LMO-SS05]
MSWATLKIRIKLIIMRIISLLIFVSISTLNGQNKFLTFEQVNSVEYLKTIENNEELSGFIISTGDTIRVNQSIKFGKPDIIRPIYNGNINREINNYTSIFIGKPETKTILRFQYFPEGYNNKSVKIKTIVGKKVRKKDPAILMLGLEIEDENVSHLDITALPHSFEIGELMIKDGILTKEVALEKLKEAKEKLNLELITQAEYDKIKAELSPIIMKE